MGEIYRDSVDKAVTFDIPGITPASAVVRRGGVEYPAAVAGNAAAIPYEITRLGGKFEVVWSYTVGSTAYTRTDVHTVVSPLFTYAELVEWDSDFNMIDEPAAKRLEKMVRAIIEHITGQKFTLEYDTLTFRGSGNPMVSLPKRLVRGSGVHDTSGGLIYSTINIGNDGWTLSALEPQLWVDSMASSNPIRNPYKSVGRWDANKSYAVTGYFGYDSVPEDIALAAKILAGDYGCDESTWRDRYIDNIRAADWRFEFDPSAWRGTGNVKVDQILQKYTMLRMAVL